MSFSATRETPTDPFDAYDIEARWNHINQALERAVADGIAPRCGHIANSYGGKLITKADVQRRFAELCELGGEGK